MRHFVAALTFIGLILAESASMAFVPAEWKTFESKLEVSVSDAVEFLRDSHASVPPDAVDHLEFARVKVLRKLELNALTYHQTIRFIERFPSSRHVPQALAFVERLAREHDFPLDEARRVLPSLPGLPAGGPAASFVDYLRVSDHRSLGFSDWAERAEKSMATASYWKILLEAERASASAEERGDEKALTALRVARDRALRHPRLRSRLNVEIARLLRKLGKNNEAEAALAVSDPLPTERARVLVERASLVHGRKDFEGSLKLLLPPRNANPELDPEVDLLMIQNQRALCRIEESLKTAQEFRKRFEKALINARGESTGRDPILMALASRRPPLSTLKAERDRLQNEVRLLRENHERLNSWFTEIAEVDASLLESNLNRRFDAAAAVPYAQEAERLLKAAEEIHSLEELSKADAARPAADGAKICSPAGKAASP